MSPKILVAETFPGAVNFKDVKISEGEGALIVFGNENDGVSEEICEIADTIVKIPMRGTKESLNVSVSAGIILYELAK